MVLWLLRPQLLIRQLGVTCRFQEDWDRAGQSEALLEGDFSKTVDQAEGLEHHSQIQL